MDMRTSIIACIYVVTPFVVTKIINIIFKKINKKKNSLVISFIKNILNALVFVACVLGLIGLFDTNGSMRQNVLMSSSVIAIVLGIVFQTGLGNIIHGIIIVIFKPFNVGDRIQIDAGNGISGYVKQITLRHVVVTNIMDNADLIIPNCVVDESVIKNLTNGSDSDNKYPLIVSMNYSDAYDKTKRDAAKKIISDCILNNPRTVDPRIDKSEDLFVKVDYTPSSVDMTCFVTTRSAENNIIACSEIKEAILDGFYKAGLEMAFNHMEISGELYTKKVTDSE